MLSLLALVPFALARDVTFPPVSPYQAPMSNGGYQAPSLFSNIDVSSDNFGGLTTFAHLPYVHCLSAKPQDVEPFDIAILGAPFDTVSLERTTHAHEYLGYNRLITYLERA